MHSGARTCMHMHAHACTCGGSPLQTCSSPPSTFSNILSASFGFNILRLPGLLPSVSWPPPALHEDVHDHTRCLHNDDQRCAMPCNPGHSWARHGTPMHACASCLLDSDRQIGPCMPMYAHVRPYSPMFAHVRPPSRTHVASEHFPVPTRKAGLVSPRVKFKRETDGSHWMPLAAAGSQGHPRPSKALDGL